MDPENKKKQRGGARLQKTDHADHGKVSAKKFFRPKPRRTRRQKVLFALYITITVIAALIVAGFIVWNFFSAPPDTSGLGSSNTRKPQTTTIIDENGEEVEIEIPGLSADRKEQFYTFLVSGISGGNTDTMMLGAYDVPNQKLSVMSLPRDTYVKWKGNTVMINSIYSRAGGEDSGIQAMKEVVGELTGVTPDFYVMLEWEAVGELVDAIGGVWFEVPFDMYCNDLSQGFKIDLKAGYQEMDGDKAMQLLRYRINSVGDTGRIDYSYGYSNGDLGRIETQQAFLKVVIEKCLQPSVLLPKLTEYIRIFQENVETDLSVSNMAYFAKSAVGGLDMDSVEFTTLPYKAAGEHLLPDAGEILKIINESFNPYQEDIQLSELNVATTDPLAGRSGNNNTAAETTDTPEDNPDDSEMTDEPETSGEPTNSNEPGTTDTPGNSGTTEQPGTSEEPTPPDDSEPPVSDNPGSAQEPDEPTIPPPPPEDAA